MAILAGPPRLDINRVSWFRFDNGRSNKRKWNKRTEYFHGGKRRIFVIILHGKRDIYIYAYLLLRKMLVDVYLGCE